MTKLHTLTTLLSLCLVTLASPACVEDDFEEQELELDAQLEDETELSPGMSEEEIEAEIEILQQMIDDGLVDLSADAGARDILPAPQASGFTWVRLRHANTDKCIYGNPVVDGQIHSWTCWPDPNMVYKMYDWGNPNLVLLIHESSSKCIEGNAVDGAPLTNRSCSNPIAPLVYELVDAGGGKKRLRNTSTNKCIYGLKGNGATMHSWTCWNDPNMEFYLDPA